MTVSYLETIALIGEQNGLAYSKVSRAMKTHLRSLLAEGLVCAVASDDVTVVTLDDPEAVVWFTDSGLAYSEMLMSAGVISQPVAETVTSKPKRSRKPRKPKAKSPALVPTPSESVEPTNPLKPEGATRRVAGNTVDQWQKETPTVNEAERIESLERKVSALMAVLAS